MNKPPRVLVVDDSSALLEIYSDIIGSAGFEVLVADTGLKALDLARRDSPDLIMLDLMMPGMDGEAVDANLKADPATASIPVLFMSSVLTEHDRREQLAGCSRELCFMSKALAPHELINSVRVNLGIK